MPVIISAAILVLLIEIAVCAFYMQKEEDTTTALKSNNAINQEESAQWQGKVSTLRWQEQARFYIMILAGKDFYDETRNA